jgi:exodeoxyribonuclease-5
MQWSPQQDSALKAVDHWFRNESKTKPVFRLFGCAGTGKSTLAKHFAENVQGQVKFASFTGNAAHVMAKKGCEGASTVHKMIYRPKIASKAHMKRLEKELLDLENTPKPWELKHCDRISSVKGELRKERENSGRMSFSLNLESDLKHAKLLILDECSMISQEIGKDLESFGVPILVLGDPEQLPPIYGQGYFTEQKPDIQLDEIHRQALDNPIIALSKLVREGRNLPLGNYGSSKVVDTKLDSSEIISYDTILVGLRRTKKSCDDRCRQLRGFGSPLPVADDSLMCVKNNHPLGLLNGQIFKAMSSAVTVGDDIVSLHIKNPDTDEEMAISAAEKLFHGQKLSRWEHEEDVQEFEYAYAITVHKSQGSQWDNILLFDQKDRFPNWSKRDRQRWLYTGITRAAERVTVMRL